jgi:hypothetical protein
MKLSAAITTLLSIDLAASANVATIWLAGNSTTTPDSGHSGTEG